MNTTTTIFRCDVQVCATAYVRAASAEQAQAKLAEFLANLSLEVDGAAGTSSVPLDDPSLPECSLSPAMTVHGIWPGATVDPA
jgi:hypothetical protein